MQQWSYKKSLSERIEEIEKIMTIDNAYLFLLPEPCDNDRVDDWSCPEKLNLVAKIENGIIQYSGGHTLLTQENGLTDIIYFDDVNNMAANFLNESLRSTDIIGRIGGDEFAALAVISREDLSTFICNRIATCSQSFNTVSDKPYYIEVSIGYSVSKYSDALELKKMLSAADLMLYENKKKRRKSARK